MRHPRDIVRSRDKARAAVGPSLTLARDTLGPCTMRPFTTRADDIVPTINREFIIDCLRGDDEGVFRMDARLPNDAREHLDISLGPSAGTCVVTLGHTRVCASTSAKLEKPTSGGSSAEGSLRVDVEISSGARRGFASAGAGDRDTRARARELGALLERGLKDARAVDVESLCVLAGKAVWVITCNVTVLAHDGNLAGAASLAACGSLMTFRRPECAIDANAGTVTVCDIDAREPIALNMHHYPIASTFCFYDEVPGIAVFDPNLDEEVTADGVVVVVSNTHDEICAIAKSGRGVSSEDVKRCARASSMTARAWTETLKEAHAEFEAKRAQGKIRTHYDGYKNAPDDDYLLEAYEKAERDGDASSAPMDAAGDAADKQEEGRGDDDDDDAESDSAEDEIDDDDDDDDADADGGEDADVLTSQKRRPSKKPSAAAAHKATFDDADVDDIDALFEKAEKHKQKALGTWEDVLPGDGDTLAGAVKPRKKLKKNADDAPKKKKKTTSKAS